jgi:hypothetical protein
MKIHVVSDLVFHEACCPNYCRSTSNVISISLKPTIHHYTRWAKITKLEAGEVDDLLLMHLVIGQFNFYEYGKL